jgi:hypothetical protein
MASTREPNRLRLDVQRKKQSQPVQKDYVGAPNEIDYYSNMRHWQRL